MAYLAHKTDRGPLREQQHQRKGNNLTFEPVTRLELLLIVLKVSSFCRDLLLLLLKHMTESISYIASLKRSGDSHHLVAVYICLLFDFLVETFSSKTL